MYGPHSHIFIGCRDPCMILYSHCSKMDDAEDCHTGLARLAILVSPKMFSRLSGRSPRVAARESGCAIELGLNLRSVSRVPATTTPHHSSVLISLPTGQGSCQDDLPCCHGVLIHTKGPRRRPAAADAPQVLPVSPIRGTGDYTCSATLVHITNQVVCVS